MNEKTIKFIGITTWIILSRAYDIYATAKFTPDLTREANPLLSVFGLGWTPLLLIIGIVTLYTIYAYYISTFRPSNFLPTEKGFHFGEFMTYIYLGKKEHWTSLLYKFPKDINRLNQYTGNLMSKLLVWAGIVTTVMWLLINYTEFYYYNYHKITVIYSTLIIGVLIIWFDWNRKLYRKYTGANSLTRRY